MAREREYDEGPEAAQRFKSMLERIISVPKSEIHPTKPLRKKARSTPRKHPTKSAR